MRFSEDGKELILTLKDRWIVEKHLPLPISSQSSIIVAHPQVFVIKTKDDKGEVSARQEREVSIPLNMLEDLEPSLLSTIALYRHIPYQGKAAEFASYGNWLYPFLGLAEEAGEVVGKIAKSMRGDHSLEDKKEEIIKELGDVMWMIALCCCELNVSLEAVQIKNIEKLEDRKRRGVIQGDGDNR